MTLTNDDTGVPFQEAQKLAKTGPAVGAAHAFSLCMHKSTACDNLPVSIPLQ